MAHREDLEEMTVGQLMEIALAGNAEILRYAFTDRTGRLEGAVVVLSGARAADTVLGMLAALEERWRAEEAEDRG